MSISSADLYCKVYQKMLSSVSTLTNFSIISLEKCLNAKKQKACAQSGADLI